MPYSFDVLPNKVWTALRSPHIAGDGKLKVYSTNGFLVGTRVCCVYGSGDKTERLRAIFDVTAIDSVNKVLSIGSPLEGTTDVGLDFNTSIEIRFTGGMYQDHSDAIMAGGNQGPQGSQGFQGDRGFQGTQGVAGEKGNTGNQGTQGFQGNQGAASTVAGPQGYQGFQGNQGGAGANGSAGTQGFQGTQGERGFQGNQGGAGAQGNQGANGIGSQGAQGSQGGPGANGTQGYQGFQGNAGAAGAQGYQGFQGSTGVGTQGVQGSQGNQGAASTVAGPQGTQGNQGVAGAGSTLAIGSGIGGSTNKSVLFVDSANKLAQASTFVYDVSTSRLGIGNATPGSLLDMQLSAPLGTTVGSTQNCLNLRTTAGNNLQFQIYANRHTAGSDFTGTEWVIRTVVDSSPFNLMRMGQLGFNSYTAFDSKTQFNALASFKDLNGGGYGNASIDFNTNSGVTESFISSGQNRYGMGEIPGQLSIGTQNNDMMFYTYGISGGLLGNNTTGYRFHFYRDQLSTYLHPDGINFYARSTTTKGLATAAISHGFVNSSGISDNTHATRLGSIALLVSSYANVYHEGLRITDDGTKAKIGFLGAAPVAKAAAPTTLEDVIAIIRNVGLCS